MLQRFHVREIVISQGVRVGFETKGLQSLDLSHSWEDTPTSRNYEPEWLQSLRLRQECTGSIWGGVQREIE